MKYVFLLNVLEKKTYELLSFHCSDDEELYLNVDVFYDSTNNKTPKEIQNVLNACKFNQVWSKK